ncbi:MAG: CoA transferase [Proteobacteria bacterium]|nr:CoA transferase [Pseudomonadota bacterium]
MSGERRGPLAGLRVLEFAGIGPGPHAAMLLADLGAEVLRIQRPGGNGFPNPVVDRGRGELVLDIRTDEGKARARALAGAADVLLEGNRPGVMERLGLGPDALCAANPRLVYGRMTGWGQEGPLAHTAGHDINYIALTGALAAMGKPGEPAAIPLNLVGDFGGGSLYLVVGVLAALFERERSGRGQVIDAAIIDGVTSLLTMFTGLIGSGIVTLDRSRNMLGGAAPFYRTYLCRDGAEISVGAIEPQFFAEFLRQLGLEELAPAQHDQRRWGEIAGRFAQVFASEDRDHWARLFEGSDACVAPVLTVAEAMAHPHNAVRGAYEERDGVMQPAPAPRLSRTPGTIRGKEDGEAMAGRWLAG